MSPRVGMCAPSGEWVVDRGLSGCSGKARVSPPSPGRSLGPAVSGQAEVGCGSDTRLALRLVGSTFRVFEDHRHTGSAASQQPSTLYWSGPKDGEGVKKTVRCFPVSLYPPLKPDSLRAPSPSWSHTFIVTVLDFCLQIPGDSLSALL